MKRSAQPIISFDLPALPAGDWHHISRRRQQALLENQVQLELMLIASQKTC